MYNRKWLIENLNSRIETFQMIGYGNRNGEYLRSALYFHWENLDTKFGNLLINICAPLLSHEPLFLIL